ncbi:hypothetical protein [Streptomyces sp. NPDC002790]|uniref:hypothetical protein n=1 Tax=Streptomyces sp. NPDC002790 TaxID=3154431 RepID=UPI0033287583
MVVDGNINFTRGALRTPDWLRFRFNVYSCSTPGAAHGLYEKLDTGDEKFPSMGDESNAERKMVGKQAYFGTKVRVGTTLLWVYVTGSKEAVTAERAEAATRLLTKRVQQAHQGLPPDAQARVVS